MTSLVVLKILYVLAIFLILSDTLLFKYFSIYVYFGGGLDFAKNSQYDVIITSDYDIVSIKLCLEVGNDMYIVLETVVWTIFAAMKRALIEKILMTVKSLVHEMYPATCSRLKVTKLECNKEAL